MCAPEGARSRFPIAYRLPRGTLLQQQQSKRALAFVLLTVLIDTIGFGIVIPVLPKLLVELTGESVSEVAAIGGWLALQSTGNLSHLFLALSGALTAFGLINAAAVAGGAWFGPIRWPLPRRTYALVRD